MHNKAGFMRVNWEGSAWLPLWTDLKSLYLKGHQGQNRSPFEEIPVACLTRQNYQRQPEFPEPAGGNTIDLGLAALRYSATSKRKPLDPSPRPIVLRRPIQSNGLPSNQRAY